MGRLADIQAAGFSDALNRVVSDHVQDDAGKNQLLAAIDKDGPEGPNVLKVVSDLQLAFKTRPGLYPTLKKLNEQMMKKQEPPRVSEESTVGSSVTVADAVIHTKEEAVMPKAPAAPKAPKAPKEKKVAAPKVSSDVITVNGPSGRVWSLPKGRKIKVGGKPTGFWPSSAPGSVLHTYFENTWRTMNEANEFVKNKGLKLPASRFLKPYMGGQYLPYGWVGEQEGDKFQVVYVDPNDVNAKYHADLQLILQQAYSHCI